MESSKLIILSIKSSLNTSDFKYAKMNVVSLYYFLFRWQITFAFYFAYTLSQNLTLITCTKINIQSRLVIELIYQFFDVTYILNIKFNKKNPIYLKMKSQFHNQEPPQLQWNTFTCNRGTTWYHLVPRSTTWYHKTFIFVRENVGALLKSI